MMEIPFSDPCFLYGDNKAVLYNTTLPESTLKKKINSFVYHAVREGVVTGEWLTGYEPTDKYVSDLLTNSVPVGDSRTCLVRGVMYYILLGWLWVFTSWDFHTRMKRFFAVSAVGINY